MIGKSSTHFQTGATTLISHSTEITGDLHFSGNLEIEGVVRGNIIANDKNAAVRVMHKGRVEGKIQAPKIVINGEVEGNVHSSQHLELAAKALVKGNVYYHFLEVVKGAQVNGKLIHEPGKGEPVAAQDNVDESPAEDDTDS